MFSVKRESFNGEVQAVDKLLPEGKVTQKEIKEDGVHAKLCAVPLPGDGAMTLEAFAVFGIEPPPPPPQPAAKAKAKSEPGSKGGGKGAGKGTKRAADGRSKGTGGATAVVELANAVTDGLKELNTTSQETAVKLEEIAGVVEAIAKKLCPDFQPAA